MKTWTADDLKIIDALSHVTKCRSMYIASEGDCSGELAVNLVDDAVILGATDVAVVIAKRWYVVHSSFDWLSHATNYTVDQLFHSLTGLKGGRVNSCRREILTTAFCSSVCTGIHGSALVIKGEPDEALFAFLAEKVPTPHRYIAFKY